MVKLLLKMFRRSCFLMLIPQILLVFLVTCQSAPDSSRSTIEDLNLQAGSPMRIQCSISNEEQLTNSTYNLSSEEILIKFDGSFLGNVTVTNNTVPKQNAATSDESDEEFYGVAKFKTERLRRFSRDVTNLNPSFGLTTYFSNIMPTSVILHWKLPSNSTAYCKLTSETTYSIWYRPVGKSASEFKTKFAYFPEESRELPYLIPNTVYEFQIFCSEREAKSYLTWNRLGTSNYVKTLPDVPYWRPEIASSSFISESEIFQNVEKHFYRKRNITLYWKNIPKEHENGLGFQYWIRVSSPYQSLIKEICTSTETTHTFTNMEPNIPYIFKIFAGNVVGNSSNSSVIVVDPDTSLLAGKIPTVYNRDYTYEIAWSGSGSEYYTLFWCKISHPPRPVRCQSSLEWLHVKSLGHVLNLPYKSIYYQFALSVNFENRTSGMIWAPCHISSNNRESFISLADICYQFIASVPSGSRAAMLYL